MSIAIRPMAANDIDAVVAVAAGAVGAPHWTREIYAKIFVPGHLVYFALVASAGFAVCGFAIAKWLPLEDDAELESIAVDLRYRRQGIGDSLLRACMQAAAKAGARSIRLEVRESNTAAIALYQRNAFSSVGRRRAYYSGPVEDAILMQAPLSYCYRQSPL